MVGLRNVMSKVLQQVSRRRQQDYREGAHSQDESMSELQASLQDIGVIRALQAEREAKESAEKDSKKGYRKKKT